MSFTYRSWLLRLEGQELSGCGEVGRVVGQVGRVGQQELRVAGQQRGEGVGHRQMLH